MARIAEDLLLLLLDNEAAQPPLHHTRLGRLLAAALLLDLAYDCRIRPTQPGEPAPAGRLLALTGPVPLDPAVRPALAFLERSPATPAAAITRLGRRAADDVLDQLLRTGQIHQIQLSAHRLRRNQYAWPLHERRRVDGVRAAILAALAHGGRADPVTAALIALLHTGAVLGPALRLDEAGARQAGQSAERITVGAAPDAPDTARANLAVTAAAVLPELG